jgi:hypothetical protein
MMILFVNITASALFFYIYKKTLRTAKANKPFSCGARILPLWVRRGGSAERFNHNFSLKDKRETQYISILSGLYLHAEGLALLSRREWGIQAGSQCVP